jgi:hypothetical protein
LEDVALNRVSEKSPLLTDVALFLTKPNVSLQVVSDRPFLSLIRRAFDEGCESHAALADRGLTKDRAAKLTIPTMNPLALNQALAALCAYLRAELLGIFGKWKYLGVSIDGVTIKGRRFLNVGIVNPISDTLPFTYDFFQDNTFDT